MGRQDILGGRQGKQLFGKSTIPRTAVRQEGRSFYLAFYLEGKR